MKTGLCQCGCGKITKIALKSNKRDGLIKGQSLRFINGHNAPLKGRIFSDEHRKKLSKSRTLIKFSVETKKKMSDTRKKLWQSNAFRKKMYKSRNGKVYKEEDYMWKVENASYRANHKWVNINLGKPDTCEHCGSTGLKGHSIHWANVDHRYQRNVEDWIRLCAKCHGRYDKQLRKDMVY